MPFVNGKFYMNPAYGRAVEGARDSEGSPGQSDRNGQGDHWVTINGNHVLIHETASRPAAMAEPRSQKERYLTIVVFNETGGLGANTKSGKGSASDLHDARVAIAEIANRLMEAGHPDQVAAGESGIYTGLWRGLAQGNKSAINSWNDSVLAARDALSGSDITNGAAHFRLDQRDGGVPGWAKGVRPTQTFGPFRNSGGGDAGPTPHIYVYR